MDCTVCCSRSAYQRLRVRALHGELRSLLPPLSPTSPADLYFARAQDEIFHVPQAQAYCRGDWKYWDPALTTPPGLCASPSPRPPRTSRTLTLLSSSLQLPRTRRNRSPPASRAAHPPPNPRGPRPVLRHRPSRAQPRPVALPPLPLRPPRSSPRRTDTSITSWTRRNNALVAQARPVVDRGRRLHARPRHEPLPAPRLVGLDVLHRPRRRRRRPHLVVVRARTALRPFGPCAFTSSFTESCLCDRALTHDTFPQIGAASLLFRQTNIIWLVFVAGQAAIAQVKRAAHPDEVVDPLLADAQPGASPLQLRARLEHRADADVKRHAADLVRTPWSLARSALAHPRALGPILGAYLPVFGLAAAFVVWNGGIVLGASSSSSSLGTCARRAR